MFDLKAALRAVGRILTFRAKREDLDNNWPALVLLVLLLTWIVGIGRWWDDPRDIPQFVRYGAGSLLYVFALSTVLWILSGLLLAEEALSWVVIVCFVGATSVPGIVYAFPVERTAPDSAGTYNLVALSFVSIYRVSLLFWFYIKIAKLKALEAIIVTGLPITVISAVLMMLGQGGRVLDIMGGLRNRVPPSAVEQILGTIGCLSFCLGPIFAIMYLSALWRRRMTEID